MRLYVNGLAKNRTGNHTGYLAGFLFLLIVMISGQKACAAVTEGEPGKTYSGEYVVIVNAGEENTESTGKLTFSNAKVNENDAAIPAIVKLNATSRPLQVKKSTTALKIKEYSAGDAVASWSSSNKKAAVVNARTGKITARKTGKTTITVTMQSGATAKCLIKVQKGRVKTKKLNVGKTAITLKKGEKYRITWERQPLTSSEKVTFQSRKKKIASVSGKGIITAKKKGTTYITVKSGSKKRKIKVTVR